MEPRSKFKNTSNGVAGAIKLDHKGEATGVPVWPGESVWLTEQEQELTAQAPRHEEDNPFVNGTFTLEVRGGESGHSRPIGEHQADPGGAQAPTPEDENTVEIVQEQPPAAEPPAPPEPETGAGPAPEGAAPEGQRAEHEEVAEVKQPAPPAAPESPAVTPPPKPLPPKAPASTE